MRKLKASIILIIIIIISLLIFFILLIQNPFTISIKDVPAKELKEVFIP